MRHSHCIGIRPSEYSEPVRKLGQLVRLVVVQVVDAEIVHYPLQKLKMSVYKMPRNKYTVKQLTQLASYASRLMMDGCLPTGHVYDGYKLSLNGL
jgi:hypothetical protein